MAAIYTVSPVRGLAENGKKRDLTRSTRSKQLQLKSPKLFVYPTSRLTTDYESSSYSQEEMRKFFLQNVIL